MHPVLGLDMTAGLDLSGCTNLASVRAALRDAVAAAGVAEAGAPGREEWILGWGLDPNSFGTIPVGSGAVEDVLAGRPTCPAWLHEADCHGQSTAAYWQDPRDYTEAVRVLARAGVQTATHAIGDAAVEHVLDTLASVVPAGSRVRHRIEHIETLPSDQVPRFAELGVVASMQPSHATDYTRADHSDNWSRRLGDEVIYRLEHASPFGITEPCLDLGHPAPDLQMNPRTAARTAIS